MNDSGRYRSKVRSLKPNAHDLARLRFTLDAFSDLSVHAIESREFSSAARSILYLLLGLWFHPTVIGIPVFGTPAHGIM